MIHLLLLLLSFFHYGGAQQTLFPPAIPLAVRSPRLSSWQFTPSGSTLGSLWPTTASHQPNASQDPSLNACHFPFIRYSNTPTYVIFLEPQHSRPRPCGCYHLLVFGICKHNKRHCESDQHFDHTYPDQTHRGCWKYAIQPYLPQPNRSTSYKVTYLFSLHLKASFYSPETG